jgi:hypothetical protein
LLRALGFFMGCRREVEVRAIKVLLILSSFIVLAGA